MFKTDLEIAQECVMDPILKVAEKIGLKEDDLEYYGKYKAKIDLDVLRVISARTSSSVISFAE